MGEVATASGEIRMRLILVVTPYALLQAQITENTGNRYQSNAYGVTTSINLMLIPKDEKRV